MRHNRILAKLRSQRGATILFALLFFIVCAVIGSIVLTAGAAAAGRLADLKEMDRRYYAVTSAAKVLEHQLNDAGTVVTRSQTVTTAANGTKTAEQWTEPDFPDRTKASEIAPLMKDAVKGVCDYPLSNEKKGRKLSATIKSYPEANPLTLTLTHGPHDAEGNPDPLNAYATFQMKPGGDVVIQVMDAQTVTGAKYFLTLNCPVHVLTNTYSTGTKTITVETITWSVASVKKEKVL